MLKTPQAFEESPGASENTRGVFNIAPVPFTATAAAIGQYPRDDEEREDKSEHSEGVGQPSYEAIELTPYSKHNGGDLGRLENRLSFAQAEDGGLNDTKLTSQIFDKKPESEISLER
jgi:hypothetical protein